MTDAPIAHRFAHFPRRRVTRRPAMLLILGLATCSGCTAIVNMHDRMSQAAAPVDGLQQTQLAHIGHVDTVDGRFEVCFQRLVHTGMLAPRGQAKLLLFTQSGDLAASFSYPDCVHIPLWCESGQIYLFGFAHVPGVLVDPAIEALAAIDASPTGNVIDFSNGVQRATLTRKKAYGSSGGVEDEDWPTR